MLTRLRPQKKAGRPRAGRECQAGSRTGGGEAGIGAFKLIYGSSLYSVEWEKDGYV